MRSAKDSSATHTHALIHTYTHTHQGRAGDAIGKGLVSNTSLRTLVLSDNYLGRSGADSLAEALVTNTSLQVLNIASSDVGECMKVCVCLCVCCWSLQVLNIALSDVGECMNIMHVSVSVLLHPASFKDRCE
jgi:hypothetical protein